MSTRVGSLVKLAGQPYAGDPHVRLEEGAPVGSPREDTQAPSTERGGNSYGLATASRPGPTLQSDPDRGVTESEYDGFGEKIGMQDNLGRTYLFSYDGIGRQVTDGRKIFAQRRQGRQ